jgi:hypothetical protein
MLRRKRTYRPCPRGLVGLLAAVMILMASCDAVTAPEPITLQSKTVSFRFEFTGDGVSPGDLVDMQSEGSIDLGPELLDDGFTKGEVLSATVTSVELERISPTNVNLNFLEEASIGFSASGISARTVAASTSLPDSRTANLSVSSGDVTAYVVAPSFQAVMSVVPETVPAAGWVLRANVTLRIDVEGV